MCSGYFVSSPNGIERTLLGYPVARFWELYGFGGVRFAIGDRFALLGDLTAGILNIGYDEAQIIPGDSVEESGPAFGIKAGVGFKIQENWEIYLKASVSALPTSFTTVDASIGLRYGWQRIYTRPASGAAPERLDESLEIDDQSVRLTKVVFDEVFPVFYKQYGAERIGEATAYNGSSSEVTDVRIELFIRRFMDDPQQVFVAESLKPQEQRNVKLSALLTPDILGITEGTRVTGTVALLYRYGPREYREEQTLQIRILHRNATIWDDDRRVSAFVTARDPVVLQLAKNVASWVQQVPVSGIDATLLAVIAMHEALKAGDIRYVIDPDSSYIELSRSDTAIDFLQFPRQTLQFGAGDCDDLAVLYAALLEAVGIETAFITVPGHILLAAKLNASPGIARREIVGFGNLIVLDDTVWLPIETTLRDAGFLEVWSRGAKQWSESNTLNQAGFFRTHEAWETFEPVGFAEGNANAILPDRHVVVESYRNTVTALINLQIDEDVARLRDRIEENETARDRNALGVLYARFGLFEQAEPQFRRALEQSPQSVFALMNIGHIAFLRRSFDAALELYQRAIAISPDSPRVILAVARTNHELENYGIVRRLYAKLKQIDDELADEYSYLELRRDQATRAASSIDVLGAVLWEEF